MAEYDGSTSHYDAARESFCQELVAGERLYAAYEAAGFKRPRGNAQRMQREPEVVARLKYLSARVAELDEVLIGYRRAEHRRALEHIATADRLTLWCEKNRTVTVGKRENGKPIRRRFRSIELRPLKQLSEAERALIDGFEVSEKGAIKVLMPKRLDARAMLAKLDGLEKPSKTAFTDPTGALPGQVRFVVENAPTENAA